MLNKVKSRYAGKKRIFSLALSLALLFFFAGSATLAQNKPEKNDTKTQKQVMQKMNQKESNVQVKANTTTKNKSNQIVSKDKTKKTTKFQHHKKQGTTGKFKMKNDKVTVKDNADKKVK